MRKPDYVDVVMESSKTVRSVSSVSQPIFAVAILGQSNGFGMSPWPLPDVLDPDLMMLDPRCLNKVFNIPGTSGTVPATTAFGNWRTAAEPLHNWLYPTPPHSPGQGGMNFGKPFGQRLRMRFPHLKVALLCTARPTTVHGMTANSVEYQDTLATMLYARDTLGATLGGIITHHGEANTGDAASSQSWDEAYIDLIERFRVDTGAPDLIAVHAQLGITYIHPGSEYWNDCKASQERVTPDRLPRSKMIRTDTYSYYYDGVHNAAACNLREGYDMAEAMVEIGHPLLTGSPYSGIAQMSFSTGAESRTLIASGPMVITKVKVGTLQNAWLTVDSIAYGSGAQVNMPEPYSTSTQITAGKVNPGPWMASFTIYDTLDRAYLQLLEGRIGPS